MGGLGGGNAGGLAGLGRGSGQVQFGEENGLLAHFMKRMNFINFEMKNKETRLALQGAHLESSFTHSVTSSVAMGLAHDKI